MEQPSIRGTKRVRIEGKEMATEAKRSIFTEAQSGNVEAQYRLGIMYLEASGEIVERNDAEAARWLSLAAAQGYTLAIGRMGYFYEVGSGHAKLDSNTAVALYRKAAERGDGWSQLRLAKCYVTGTGTIKEDEAQAIFWFTKAAENNQQEAQLWLHRINPHKYSLDEKWTCKEAIRKLGQMYEKGEGVEVDAKKAIEYYEQAAELGSFSAMNALVYFWPPLRSDVVCAPHIRWPIDESKTLRWLVWGASKGDPFLQIELSRAYNNDSNLGLNKNDDLAWVWAHKAAAQGCALGIHRVAELYDEVGSTQNLAIPFFQMAYERGVPQAAEAIAIVAHTTNRLDLYIKAAVGGYEDAQTVVLERSVNDSRLLFDIKESKDWPVA